MNELSSKKVMLAITKSNWGGAQSYVYALAVAAAEYGAEVVVAAGGAGVKGGEQGLLTERLASSNIRVLPLTRITRDIGFINEWRAFLELLRILRQEHPDVLHLNSSKMGVLGALAGRMAGVSCIIFTAHGWPHREPTSFISTFVRAVGSWVSIVLAHRVIVVSECDARGAPVLFSHKKIVCIHNGVKEPAFLERTDARETLSTHAPSLRDFPIWMGMHAELHTNKGIDTAIEALSLLKRSDVALVVLGSGEEETRLKACAQRLGVSSQVFLCGFVKDASTYLQAYDLYLMPSRKEGLPMALLEAGMAGLPVVASRVGGIPEVVLDNETGLLVPTEAPKEIKDGIEKLLSNPSLAGTFGQALRAHVAQHFSEHEMLERTLRQYN